MLSNGLGDNLRFLLLEVTQQLDRCREFLVSPSPGLYESVFTKEDYVNHLKSIIQRKCFDSLQDEAVDEATVAQLKAVDVTATNLERIADYCKNLVDQARYIDDASVLREEEYVPLFAAVESGLGAIQGALFQRDTRAALKVCETEGELDGMFRREFNRILEQLKEGESTRSLVSSLFIYRYLERMGDSLLNVGEAILSVSVGESIQFSRLNAIQDVLDLDEFEQPDAVVEHGVVLEPVAETRSGCSISRLRLESGEQAGQMMIVKDGRLKKVLEEKASSERWQEISPGLVPQVLSTSREGDHGALLFEYLPGNTFQQLLLEGSSPRLDRAFERLCETLGRLWDKTNEPTPASAGFVKQVRKRLDAVLAVHPRFAEAPRSIAGRAVPGLVDLLDEAAAVEEGCQAPFSVYIHGDLNVDNIIYDQGQDQIRFIDLHRSRMQDYVQDVSVFVVSNLRLQVFDSQLRRRLGVVAERFCAFGRDLAERTGDATFEVRLGLGLARSFLTSTRFLLDPGLASWHFLRARYLLERVVRGAGNGGFRISPDLFFD